MLTAQQAGDRLRRSFRRSTSPANAATNSGGLDGGAGILLLATSGAIIRGNTLTGNHVGVALNNGANGNTVVGNRFTDNHELSAGIGFSDDNIVTFNRIMGSNGGLILEAAPE